MLRDIGLAEGVKHDEIVFVAVLARFADAKVRVIPLLLLCVLLIIINVGIFVVGLRIAIPLWPAVL